MFAPSFPLGFRTALEVRGFAMGPPKHALSDNEAAGLDPMHQRIERTMKAALAHFWVPEASYVVCITD